MNSALPLLIFTSLISASLPAGEAAPGKMPVPPAPELAAPSRSHFRISAGAAWRSIGDINFVTGSQSGQLRLPFPATALGRRTSMVGGAEEYADRQYRDGFVHQDAGTAEDGSTWFWGYQNAGQLSSGNTLTYQGQGNSVRQDNRSAEDADPGAWAADAEGAVPVIQLDWEYDLRPTLRAGLSLQYSLLGFDGSKAARSFTATQQQISKEINVQDLYELGSVIAPLAPYEGSLAGPGPLINNRPTTRNFMPGRVIDRSEVLFQNRLQESFDVQLHRLAIGPTMAARLGPVDLTLGAGLALNIADWSATHTETLYVSKDRQPARIHHRWSDRRSGTAVLPGLALQLAARLTITPRLSFTAFGSHDWSQTLTGTVGPSRFHLDPTGWTVGGMVGYSF